MAVERKIWKYYLTQLKRLGASCDWSRTTFTMDPEYSEAVTKVFVDLYNDGMIYKGERIINWDPKGQTALSDEEVIHKEISGHLWHFKYPIKDSKEYIVIATTDLKQCLVIRVLL